MDQMTATLAVVAVAIVVAAFGAWWLMRRRRSEELKQRFGPEYERAVSEYGDERRAESALDDRVKRMERLEIRTLSADEHERFAREWRSVQARFVDNPPSAVTAAHKLVQSVMTTRGYPVGEFEQNAADISVDHPIVVEHYRAAHAIVNRPGTLSTEDFRKAMVHYRALFDDLLETAPTERVEEREEARR